jgi:hypothetical protein
LPKKKTGSAVSVTNTYNPSATSRTLSLPDYYQHLNDIYSTRINSDSKTLMKDLFVSDPDVSATVASNLTLANTSPIFYVYNQKGELDSKGYQTLQYILDSVFTVWDYTQGFSYKPTLRAWCESQRYMSLLRGMVASELTFDKAGNPSEMTVVDSATLEWFEKEPGVFKPQQKTTNVSTAISLDIPTFSVGFFRRDPTEIYTKSPYISAINTIASRQQVVNDLYRIMQVTGYPRLSLKVMEEVLVKNAPPAIKADPAKLREYVTARLTEAANRFSDVRPDQVYAHTEAEQPGAFNDTNPGMALDISQVISVLNAQNQAALKAVPTILGRGEGGVNTASVEARLFALGADELNNPIEEVLGAQLTLAIRMLGYKGRVEVEFKPVELRPTLELEPQMTSKQARLLELLSLGIISDTQFHVEMFGTLPPAGTAQLSGTNFNSKKVDTSDVSSNSDPLGRSLVPEGSNNAKSNSVKK